LGSLLSRRIECAGSMHDWEIVASAHIVDIFGVAMPPCDEA
jgi:hypothetical protein